MVFVRHICSVSIPKGAIMSNINGEEIDFSIIVSIPKGAIMSILNEQLDIKFVVSIPKGAIMRH